jgi:hypothetical protein
MNKVLVFSTVISAMLMILTACGDKEDETPQPTPVEEVYFESDTTLKRGQAVNVRFAEGSTAEDLAVAPNDGVKVFAGDKSARILFTQPGRFTVTARAKASGQVFVDTVDVIDAPYFPPVYLEPHDLAADDIVTLEPMSFKDDVLVFHARGKKSYTCLTTLVYVNSSTSTAVNVDFLGTPNAAHVLCMVGPYDPPSSFVYTKGYANGTHNITIRLGKNLTTYTGTFTVTDDKITFNWPDNIPVVIAPKEIDRVK